MESCKANSTGVCRRQKWRLAWSHALRTTLTFTRSLVRLASGRSSGSFRSKRLPIPGGKVACELRRSVCAANAELTAAGTAPDLHRCSLFISLVCGEPEVAAKVRRSPGWSPEIAIFKSGVRPDGRVAGRAVPGIRADCPADTENTESEFVLLSLCSDPPRGKGGSVEAAFQR